MILRDENDTILASTTLGQGSLSSLGGNIACFFFFNLTDVPDTAKFYAISISQRGEMSYSHDQMVAQNWVLILTLG